MPIETSLLLTDLYQLTMLQCYDRTQMRDLAVFELFMRRLPRGRNFLVAAGLEQAISWLESARFTQEELAWLTSCRHFRADFVEHLAVWRFTGDVEAMPEGTIFFGGEPILRVTAPIAEAQLVESRLINLMQFQTMIASKAARCVLAAPGLLVDFGFRRAHGAEAGLVAARATYLAGFAGTATVEAGREFGIPLFGTMAHSLIQSIGDDAIAFERFARACPQHTTFLLDTFDTEEAARITVQLAPRLRAAGITINAVRLDSGDLAAHARAVRAILDAGGLRETTIFVSGGLDEYELAKLIAAGAPIDGFGVGTSLDVSADAPYTDCVYKLVEYAGQPSQKRSEGKATLPGRKQVYRQYDAAGLMVRDEVTVETSPVAGQPLLVPVMHGGKRTNAPEALETIRHRVASGLARLPAALQSLEVAPAYPVEISPALEALSRDH